MSIRTQSLGKTYGKEVDAPALRNVNLSVDDGESLGLLGANGAGKSTVIKLLSTLIRPTSGRATVDGFDIDQDTQLVRSRIGVVQQEAGLHPDGRVWKLLLLHARLSGLDRRAAEDQAKAVLQMVGLEGSGMRRTWQLSGGMRRRLDIGLALIHQPRVLLLDEPTAGLDPASRRACWAEFERLRDEGACVLLATQDLEEVERLADRVAVLKGGTLLHDDIAPGAVRDLNWVDGSVVSG